MDLDIKKLEESIFTNDQESDVVKTRPYFESLSSKELFSRLSNHSICLNNLLVELDFVPSYEYYDEDWDRETRTRNDVVMDMNYNLWEIQKVVKELCERFNVKVG